MDSPLRKIVAAAVLALLTSASTVTPAAAAEMDRKAKADAKAALVAYKEGRYEDAAKLFVSLSVDHPDMLVFVRNLGACYYYLHRPEPALSNLRDYLHRKKDITAEDRQEVERWIDEMSQERSRSAGAPAPAVAIAPVPAGAAAAVPEAPVAQSPGAAAAPSEAALQAPGDSAIVSAPPGDQSHGSAIAAPAPAAGAATVVTPPVPDTKTSRIGPATWVLGGVGGLGLVTGTVFAVLSHQKFSQVEDKYNPSEESKGKTYSTIEWVGFGVGVAAIAGAVITALPWSSPPSRVSYAPTVGPGMAGATMGMSF
jgi:hypothetical protein